MKFRSVWIIILSLSVYEEAWSVTHAVAAAPAGSVTVARSVVVAEATTETSIAAVSEAESSRGTKWEESFGVDFGLRGTSFPNAGSSQVNDYFYQIEAKPTFDVNYSESMKFTGKILFISDPVNKSQEERAQWDFPEFNIKWKGENSSVKVGQEIYSWGITDGFNPLDFVNTRNYFDPIHARKIGAFSLAINWGTETTEMDLIYVPRARSSILPGTNSRWLPRNMYVSSNATGAGTQLLLPKQFEYSYSQQNPLDSALDHNLALRLQFHFEGKELAFYAHDGVAAMPLITPYVSGTLISVSPIQVIQVNSNVELRLQDYREKVGGVSFSKSFDSWQIKGVGAWAQSYPGADQKQGWSQSSALAIEKTWAPSENTNLVTILQYAYCNRQAFSGNDLASMATFFNRNVMMGGLLSWRDTHSVTFFYSNDTLTQSWLGDLSYEVRMAETLRVNIKTTLLDGPNNSALGIYSDNKNVSIGMNWSY